MQPISSNYRSTPPSSAVQINRGNPIARGLQRAWFASTGIDHVSGIPAVNSAATHNVPGQNQFGATLRCSGAQSMESYTVPHITAMDGGREFTVFTVSTTNSGAERPLAGVWGKTGYKQFYLAISDYARYPLIAATDGTTNRVYSANVATVPAGVRVTVAGGWRSSDDACSIWLNGSPVTGTKSGSTVSAMPTVSNPVSIATQGTGGFAALSGDIELVLIFNRLLSDAEIRSLSANPYQILQARHRFWVDQVAGAGDATASGDLPQATTQEPSASAAGAASASADSASATTTAATGSGTGQGAATGSGAAITLSAPEASASGTVTAAGDVTAVRETAATGAAVGGASGSGLLSTITLSAPTASVSLAAQVAGDCSSLQLSAATGAATGGATVTAGNSSVQMSAAIGAAYIYAEAVGSVGPVTLFAGLADAAGTAQASGGAAQVTLAAPTGLTATSLVAVGSLPAVQLQVATGSAVASAFASGSLPTLETAAPTAGSSADGRSAGDIGAIALLSAEVTAAADADVAGSLPWLQLDASLLDATEVLGYAHADGGLSQLGLSSVFGSASNGGIRCIPGSRVLIVEPESRVYVVGLESRVLVVD